MNRGRKVIEKDTRTAPQPTGDYERPRPPGTEGRVFLKRNDYEELKDKAEKWDGLPQEYHLGWRYGDLQLRRVWEQMSELNQKLKIIKPILKQIEQSTNSRPPQIGLEELHLNEQWFRVWEIFQSSTPTARKTE